MLGAVQDQNQDLAWLGHLYIIKVSNKWRRVFDYGWPADTAIEAILQFYPAMIAQACIAQVSRKQTQSQSEQLNSNHCWIERRTARCREVNWSNIQIFDPCNDCSDLMTLDGWREVNGCWHGFTFLAAASTCFHLRPPLSTWWVWCCTKMWLLAWAT